MVKAALDQSPETIALLKQALQAQKKDVRLLGRHANGRFYRENSAVMQRFKITAICVLFSLLIFAPAARAQTPDLILHNGNVITMDDRVANAAAVAVRGDQITTVGTNEQVLKLAGPNTKIIDLKNKTLVPGLIDTHIHIISGGRGMKNVQLAEATSIAELLEVIASHIRDNKVPAGEWVVASSDWYVNQLKENRFPTRWELDRVAPQNPVILPRGGHQSASNSLALKLGGITKDTPTPNGGEIGKDESDEPNGMLVDKAQEPIKSILPKEDENASVEALQRVQALAHSLGITSLVDGGVNSDEWQTMEQVRQSGQLKIRLAARVRPRDVDDFKKINATLSPEAGDAWLRTGPIKVTLDGGSTGSLFTRPYPGKPDFYGVQVTSTDVLKGISELANENNWRMSVHCNGDKAFDILLDTWEAVNAKKSIVDRRWTVEHGKFIRPDQMQRVKALGLLVTIQAAPYVKGETYITSFGTKMVEKSSPTRDYLKTGIILAGGSDWLTNPLNPFLHMYFAVARKTKAGTSLGPDQALTPEEALAMHTKYAAYVTFEEDSKGTITPGKLADLAVLSDDPLKVATDQIKDIKALMTVVGGEVVYQRAAE
jgi:predicted amidohydrolase YtcJ